MIKKFNEFISEELAYLAGHRQPLYHFTQNINGILQSDMLKLGNPARGSHGKTKAIAVTRNPDFAEHGSTYIELDYSKLYNDGYKAFPIDEWAWNKNGTPNPLNKERNFGKANFPSVLKGNRGTKHGTNIPHKLGMLETEFEERFYTDIKDLGKYIISINYEKGRGDINILQKRVKEYLEKYPHIKVYNVEKSNHRKKTDITDTIINTIDKPESPARNHYVDDNGNIVDRDTGKFVYTGL